MTTFHGDLLIGGLAIKNLDGVLLDQEQTADGCWTGRFEIDPCQSEPLELGRQYLLILDDGRNHEVVLTDMKCAGEGRPVVCEFTDCPPPKPK